MTVTQTERGVCFAAAFSAATQLRDQGAAPGSVLIAHGLPVGTGGIVEGKRYWHAWVEVYTARDGWKVLDTSKRDRPVLLQRDRYYRIGRLANRYVWRFSLADAERNLDRTGHGGPWVKGWQAMGAFEVSP